MELSAKALREAEFRERRFGGYDPDDVDTFLEDAALQLDALFGRLREAEARIARAEQQRAEAEQGRGDAEDAVRRTLVLAQRTADLAIAEAQQQAAETVAAAERHAAEVVAQVEAEAVEVRDAARAEAAAATTAAADAARATLEDAETHARRVREEADTYAAGIRAEADTEARAHATAIVREAEARVAGLDAERDALLHDVGALRRFVESERSRLVNLLDDVATRARDGFVVAPLPDLRGPAAAVPDGADATVRAEVIAHAAGDAPAASIPPVAVLPEPPPFAPVADAGDEQPAEDEQPIRVVVGGGGGGGGGGIAGREHDGDRPTAHDDDPFLAELRRAVDDDAPLGPRDDDADGVGEAAADGSDFDENHPFFANPPEERSTSRFRRR